MPVRFEMRFAAEDLAACLEDAGGCCSAEIRQVARMPAQILKLTSLERSRSRLACLLPDGQGGAIILPAGQFMHPGDRLISTCGSVCLQIEPATQPLMRIEAANAFALMRIVYHLANRHVPAMLTPDAVLIEPDAVLASMVSRLGATVTHIQAGFLPEAGAYAGSHEHRDPVQSGHHHGEINASDVEMGRIGEILSRQAHEARDRST